jgi:hypothetical protein
MLRLFLTKHLTTRRTSHHYAPISSCNYNNNNHHEKLTKINDQLNLLGNLFALQFFLLNGVFLPCFLCLEFLKN